MNQSPSFVPSFKGFKHSQESREKIGSKIKGRYVSLETRQKRSLAMMGKNRTNGNTKLNNAIRQSFQYKLWRKAVFERDKYTCTECFKVGGRLNADHIKPFARFPELRFLIDNGRTLCVPCHLKTDTWGGKSRLKSLN